MTSLYSDLISDLEDARKSSLLIEIQRKHIDQITQERSDFIFENYCENIFNKSLGAKETNVVVVDAERGTQAQILTTLYALLKDSLKNKKSLDSSLKLGLYFATLGLSELIDKSISNNVSDFLGKTIDGIDDSISRWIGDKAEEQATDSVEDTANKIINTGNSNHQHGTELYLSEEAKAKVLGLATKLSSSHTPHEAMQFMVEFISSLGLGAPKLIVINDPFSLDVESLSLCSLLFSHAKDLKLQGEDMPISIVFNYTTKQPYEAEIKNEKNALALVRLRHMTQRYGMLEKPGSSIPRPAIKSTTFVGRGEELIQLKQSHNSLLETLVKNNATPISQWTLIKGEPGTGKTALINKYINGLTEQKDVPSISQIRLRLLNQIGHSSEVTGLASLLQSIQSESNRLTLSYQEHTGWLKEKIDKNINTSKELVTIGKEVKGNGAVSFDQVKKAARAIASLTSTETLYGSLEAAVDRYSLDKSQMQTADAFHEGGSRNKKQEQFNKLVSALRHLRDIAKAVSGQSGHMPILLFIDDLQWIDELSAEFIITHLVGVYPVEFLITARESDSETIYKSAKAESEHSPFKLEIFDIVKLGVASTSSQFVDKNETSGQRIMPAIRVEGMNKSTVISLINEVYFIDSKFDVGVIANSLIKALGGENDVENEHVNTLFVIETLNLLSDPAFYRRFDGVSPLFINNEKGAYTINAPSESDFVEQVEHLFELLKDAHKSAYSHESMKGSEGHQFTLSSYAVMEERLFLIHQYFAELGDTATFTLQLSSLLSTPFNSDIVQEIIGQIKTLDEASLPDLAPLKTYLNKQQGACLTPEHYELLEEVFEIIRRLPDADNLHQYRHGLFSTFLRQHSVYTLNTIFNQDDNKSKLDPFFLFIDGCLHRKWKEVAKKSSASSIQFNRCLLLLQARNTLLNLAYELNHERWAGDYSTALCNLAYNYQEVGRVAESMELEEQSLVILESLYQACPDRWVEDYTITLGNLACNYIKVKRVKKSLELYEKSLKIREELYRKDPEHWEKHYVIASTNLACGYKQSGQVLEAIQIEEKLLKNIERFHKEYIDVYVEGYTLVLNSLASSYNMIGQFRRAIKLAEKSLMILNKFYEKNRDYWREYYTTALTNLAQGIKEVGNVKVAIKYFEQLSDIFKELYKQHQERWKEDYKTSLWNLVSSYQQDGRFKDAIKIHRELLEILKPFDEANPEQREEYAIAMNKLCYCLQQDGNVTDAIKLYELSLKELKQLYSKDSDMWGKAYTSVMNNLANCYKLDDRHGEVIKLLEQLIHTYKELYEAHECWAEYYINTLNNLAVIYFKNDNPLKFIELSVESINILKPLYKRHPKRWEELHETALNNLASVILV
jgi:hypothetical protein